MLPGGDRVGPRLDLEGPRALGVRGDERLVVVGLARVLGQRDGSPAPAGRVGQHDVGAEPSWPSRKTVAETGEGLADGRLGRLPAEVDDGHDVEDGDASDHAPTIASRRVAVQATVRVRTPVAARSLVEPGEPCEPVSRPDDRVARLDTLAVPASRLDQSMNRSGIGSIQRLALPSSMRAIRRFTVRPVLPAALAPLGDLARNLRWSWHPPTQDLFAAVDPAGVGVRRPRPGAAARRRGPRAAATSWPTTTASSQRLERRRRTSTATSPATAGTSARRATTRPRAIAYFSPEFGITAVLPQYSGGLGILAGDHLKAASDLGVPIIGVGLLYRHGYFRQSLSREGWQQERYPVLDPDGLPLSLLREADGTPRHGVDRAARRPDAGRPDLGRQVGRVPLLLLDSDVEENPEPSARSPTGCTAAAASTGCSRRCCSASAASARCAPTPGSPAPPRPRCSTPTRATPASSASSGSAS